MFEPKGLGCFKGCFRNQSQEGKWENHKCVETKHHATREPKGK